MSKKDGHSPNPSSENATSSNISGMSSALSGSVSNLAAHGRRPIIIKDHSQRAMLHKIRDSLAHLQKGPVTPDSSGASGTSTPNKDGNKDSIMCKRSENYNNAAMAEIKKSLQTFKKDDAKDDLEATAKVNVKELIQQISLNEPRNGLQYVSKFGGLVPPNKLADGSSKNRTEVLASSEPSDQSSVAGAASPPPLPPRTRVLSTPPPPLPPRDTQTPSQPQLTSSMPSGAIPSASSHPNNTNSAASSTGNGPLSRTLLHYQPIKRPSNKDTGSSTSSTPRRTSSPNPSPVASRGMAAPSATPPSSLEQLAEQTGLTTQEIQDILMQHSYHRNKLLQQPIQSNSSTTNNINPLQSQVIIDQHNSSVLAASTATAGAAISGYEYYTNNIDSRHYPAHVSATIHQHQQQQYVMHSAALASPPQHHQHQAAPPPPPQYSSAHIISAAPPPPYNTSATHYQQSPAHQPSPASSVTSGSSNDYLLLNYAQGQPYIPGEYRTPAYGTESHSSGSSSPASLHSHTNYPYLHPSSAGAVGHILHHPHLKPTPITAWEAKQQPVVTQSARSQLVSRPLLHTGTATAPPSYTCSVQAGVVNGGLARNQGSPVVSGGGHGGNVHIKLRNHQDPQFQVTGHPSFQVTAQNSQHIGVYKQPPRNNEHMSPTIQIQFSTGSPINPLDATNIRRKGSLETRSDSPVSRTTNQSPCSMISTTSNNSDLIPERPPPPYPGPSKPYVHIPNGAPMQQQGNNHLLGAISSEQSEPEQSETESESDKRSATHRCTSPIPKLREAEKKDDDRRWTKLRHYSPAAFKFYMEQHIENVLKQHRERTKRRVQLEQEMSKVDLSEEARNQMRLMLKQKETNYLRLKRAKMDRSMFDVISKLGIGAFGEVSLVRKCHIDTDESQREQLYAMKTLRKVDVIRRNQVAHVKAERDILAEAELEWVTKLYYSFQDKENLYFIMEYIPGGDLMALLIKKGIFEENLAIFYIAELVLAIESVHKMGFIHRDIKPDNILIDKDGHIKLTDFGLCTGFRWTHNSKYYQEGHNRQDSMDPQDVSTDPCQCPQKEINKILERRRRKEKQRCLAHSLVGTPNYIAPEVLQRQGYTKSCDWWSVGVILFEMLVGHPPFYANTPKETQIKVVNWRSTLHVPSNAELSTPSEDLIHKLCCAAENRLGRNGADEIKKHPFFESINFSDLRRQKAPHKPVIKYPTDTSNFDEVEEQEPCPYKTDDLRLNGHYPEHAFSEFTFRRFFDDGGHAKPLNIAESLSHGLPSAFNNMKIGNSHSSRSGNLSEERTPQNSYHEEETRGSAGNPVYV